MSGRYPIIRSSRSGIVPSIIIFGTLACLRSLSARIDAGIGAMNRDSASHPEFRARWRNDWLWAITEFADYDLQRKSWSGGEQYDSPYWSYVEWTCRYFNDLGLDSGDRVFIADGFVSRDEADAALAFHTALDAYEPPKKNSYDFEAILSDPAWKRVVSLADSTRLQLLTLISAPVEHGILTRHYD